MKPNEKNITFNLQKMRKLAKQDTLINFLVNDLTNCLGDETKAYETVFNSEVLDDFSYEDIYKSL